MCPVYLIYFLLYFIDIKNIITLDSTDKDLEMITFVLKLCWTVFCQIRNNIYFMLAVERNQIHCLLLGSL